MEPPRCAVAEGPGAFSGADEDFCGRRSRGEFFVGATAVAIHPKGCVGLLGGREQQLPRLVKKLARIVAKEHS